MDHSAIISRMQETPAAIGALVSGLTASEFRHKPPSGAWSIVEITAHLVDEERVDFRARLRSTLEDPGRKWPPTDPEGWARDRGYQSRELSPLVAEFAREREASLLWLRSLGNVDWKIAYIHPKVGPVTAGELLVSWAAHDALHVRQIAKRMFELAARDGEPEGFSTRYAGEWSA